MNESYEYEYDIFNQTYGKRTWNLTLQFEWKKYTLSKGFFKKSMP